MGRREEPLEALGCDLGGTAIKLVRLRNRAPQASLEVPTPSRAPAREIVATLARALETIAVREGGGSSPIAAAGVAVPGFLDPRRSRVIRLSNLPALNGTELRRSLERRLGLRVVLDTDTNAGAVAEAVLGAGKGQGRVLYLTLGTGLGAAMTIHGEPVRTSRHTVGQVAHIPIEPEGRKCRCGRRGCAEAVLSSAGILWRARRAGLDGISSTRELWDAAGSGGSRRTRAALRIWNEIGEAVGRLCVILGALLSPEVIVVGGGVAGAAELFLPGARAHLTRELTPRLGAAVQLMPAALGKMAGATGAALLALRVDS